MMTKTERRRRVALLCCSFARNLAYYRAGQGEHKKALLCESHPKASFWRQINVNFLDIFVLDWCKLFADKNGPHHWRQVVSCPAKFEPALLQNISMDATCFEANVKAMKHYRDKFVAHLDSEGVMNIPKMDTAKASVWFYYNQIVEESEQLDLAGLPESIEKLTCGYEYCLDEAISIFSKNTKFGD